MRVATLQLVADGGANVVEIKAPFFLSHLGVEHHLEQQVAKFTAQVVKIFASDGIEYFVGFFQRVGGDGAERLLFIPRAAVFRVTQALHNTEQSVDLSHAVSLQK